MYWLIESNIEVIDYDVFSFRPEHYDTNRYFSGEKFDYFVGGTNVSKSETDDDNIDVDDSVVVVENIVQKIKKNL